MVDGLGPDFLLTISVTRWYPALRMVSFLSQLSMTVLVTAYLTAHVLHISIQNYSAVSLECLEAVCSRTFSHSHLNIN